VKVLRVIIGIVILLTLFVVVSVSPVYALEDPSLYYDWNTYSVDGNVLGLEINAQENVSDKPADADYKNFLQHDYFFNFAKDLAPGNPLYLLKRGEESAVSLFTFNREAKDRVRLEFAGERLSEMQKVASGRNVRALNSLARSYRGTMEAISEDLENLSKNGQDVTDFADRVDLEASRHNLVLEEVLLAAPDAATGGIKNAISASELAVDTVADVEDRPAVPEAVVSRLKATEALGILTPEEVGKIIDSETRKEARSEVRKYVNADLFPESDFKKFDETSLEKYPQGFYTVQEIKKFQELKELETQKPDEATIKSLQEFAKTYKAGDTVPGELRQWWVPTVRLEELQNTIRPDLINQDFLRNRPDYLQKYQEVVERIKPTKENAQYVNDLISKNPDLLNDPSYARLKALSDRFGFSEERRSMSQNQACGTGYHWASVPFMPNGGYCVPNYQFTAADSGYKENVCPSGYHRPSPGSACYADNPEAAASWMGSFQVAVGSCPSGYGWISETTNARGGYCAPRSISDGGFPNPVYTVGYCLPGQAFRDGKCETYNPPPANGCPSGSWWNGTNCIQQKTCDRGYYQDNSGECKQTTSGGSNLNNACPMPSTGCGNNSWWDYGTCSCRSTTTNNTNTSGTSRTSFCSNPPNCGPGYYVDNTCTCKPYSPTSGGQPGGPGAPFPGNSSAGSGAFGGGYDASGKYVGGSYGGYDSAGKYVGTGSSGGSGGTNYTNTSQSAPSGTPSRESQEAACRAGGGTCTGWYNNACSCITNNTTSTSPSVGCGSGYYWNGSNCAPSSQPTESQPPSQPPPPETSQPAPVPQEPPPSPPPAP